MKNILYIFLAFFSIISCDNREFLDDKDVVTAYPFEFFVEPTQNYYLESIGDINLKISNTQEVRNQDYSITYRIIGGNGEIYVNNLINTDSFTMKKGSKTIGFKGLQTGEYKLIFTASNGKEEYNVTKEITINITLRPFTLNVDVADEMYISEVEPLKLKLNIDNPSNVTYKWLWDSEKANSLIQEVQEVSKNEVRDITPNQTYSFNFNPKEILGVHKLIFTGKDSQGQIVSVDKDINVKNIDFTASLTPVQNDLYFDEVGVLLFNFRPEFISELNRNQYKITYIAENTSGTLSINGTDIRNRENVILDDFPLEDNRITFTPDNYNNNTAKITLEITDKYGYSKTISAVFNIKLKPFEIFTTKQTTEYLLPNSNIGGRFNVEVRTSANIDKMKYKVRIVSSSNDSENGYFELNGVRINYNEDFILTGQFTNLVYQATAYGSGKHQFDFQVKDIANQSPTNQVSPVFFDIYKKLEIRRLVAKYTLKQIRNGTVLRPSRWEIKSYLDFELVGTSKIKSIQIIGTEFERPFDEMVSQAQINQIFNNTMSNLPLKQGQFNNGRTPVHKEGDPLNVIFTDENGYTTEGTAYFVEQRI